MLRFLSLKEMSLYQQTLGVPLSCSSNAKHVPTTAKATAQATAKATKIVFIISRDLLIEEFECLEKHGKTTYLSSLKVSDWKYLIVDIRIEFDRQWLISNISCLNEYIVVITGDRAEGSNWLQKLIKEECVTNILKKLPIIYDESFDRRVINNVWIPKRSSLCRCL